MAADFTVTPASDAPGKGRAGPPLLMKTAEPLYCTIATLAVGAADTYVTGGYPITALFEQFGKGVKFGFASGGGFLWSVDLTNKKVLAYSTSGAEVANAATTVRNVTVTVFLFGR